MIRMSGQSRLMSLGWRWVCKANVAVNRHKIPSIIILLALVHALLWIAAPLLYIDGLHVDTLEMAAWGQKIAFGYPKHPPLGTWLVAVATHLPSSRVFNLLVLSQISLLATVWFIWKSTRVFGSQLAAAFAVILFLECAAATAFSLQINHNLLSMPFEAALLYFGLSYLETPSRLKAVIFGVVAGLALLTKYETLFFHLSLCFLCVLHSRYRRALVDPRSYLAIAVCCLVFAPHLVWDWRHGWATMGYAVEDRPIQNWTDVFESANQLLDGILVVGVGPTALLAFIWRMSRRASAPGTIAHSMMIGLAPLAFLLLLSVATEQVIRQGWLLPLTPAFAICAGLIIAARREWPKDSIEQIGWCALRLSALQAFLVAGFIVAHSILGVPIASYSFDSSELSASIASFWRKRSGGPLECLAVETRGRTLGPILYLDPTPAVKYIDETAGRPCRNGGLAVLPSVSPHAERLEAAGFAATEVAVSPELALGSFTWPVKIFYLPPEP